eukprot:XP_015136545.1 zinc finger family member 767 isoform X4 [Gallus gallus]
MPKEERVPSRRPRAGLCVCRELLGCGSSPAPGAAPAPLSAARLRPFAAPIGLRVPALPSQHSSPAPRCGVRGGSRGRRGAAIRTGMAGLLLVRAVSARLLRLEGRLARAERRLRAALALRGRVRALERRLEPPRGAPRCGDGARGARQRRDCGRKDGGGSGAAAGSEDSSIRVKEEEESCTAAQEELEAAGAVQEPCPGQTKGGTEVYSRELPGTAREDLPGDTAESQTCVTAVLSWIKQEEELQCPEQQGSEKEEIPTEPGAVHDENRRDPLADSFVSTMCDSGMLERPEEKFHEDPSPALTWDSQWGSEMMETTTSRNGFGGDAQYDRAFGEHLDLFNAQQNDVRKRLCVSSGCERNYIQQEHLSALQGAQEELLPVPKCENSPIEVAFQHPVDAAGEKFEGLPAKLAPSSAGRTRLREHNGLCREDRPSVGSRGKLPAENVLSSPCEANTRDASEAPRGGLASQQQSQGKGKSYICNDCGKSFVCHSWLVRHQTSHTSERPYKCSKCDKSYRRKDYLLKHLRRHSGEGLFPCHLCSKRFVLRRSLIKHQESHVQRTHQTAIRPCAEIKESVLHSR